MPLSVAVYLFDFRFLSEVIHHSIHFGVYCLGCKRYKEQLVVMELYVNLVSGFHSIISQFLNGRTITIYLAKIYDVTHILVQSHYSDVIMGTMASQITSLTILYSTVYLGRDQWKYQSYASLAFVRGIHRRPVNSSHKWPVTRKMFPFDDVNINRTIWTLDLYSINSN